MPRRRPIGHAARVTSTPPQGPQDTSHWPVPQDSPTWPTLEPTPPPAPRAAAPRPFPATTADGFERDWKILSSGKRIGTWQVPSHLAVNVALGDYRIDLREAQLTSAVTTIDVTGLLGDVKVIVPIGYRVECTGAAIAAEFEIKGDAPATTDPSAPLIRVKGAMVLGDVSVHRTADPVGQGSFSVDGLSGVSARRRQRREQRRARRLGR